ncbi:MAG: acyl carrier protein [Clostridia bacterium]|nr:acyl carrier protein [Clostridia bacterium]
MQLSREDCLEKLRDILLDMDGCDPVAVKAAGEGTRLLEDLQINSVGMLYLVIVIEESFDIRFENVGISAFRTVGDVLDYIGDKKK